MVDFPIAGMAGDVNLYWNDIEEPNTVEIEIMVAEAKCRRKGVAYEALNCDGHLLPRGKKALNEPGSERARESHEGRKSFN